MTKVKFLSVALLAAAALTTQAMARESNVGSRHATVDAYASARPVEGYAVHRGCVRAPRVGAFATAPWTNPPCEPNTAY